MPLIHFYHCSYSLNNSLGRSHESIGWGIVIVPEDKTLSI